MNKKLSDSIIVNHPIHDVWNEITNIRNFYSFSLGSHTKFDQNILGGGDTFTGLGRLGGKTTYYVVELFPPHYFGWGMQPNSIDFSFELTQLGRETEVRYSCIYDYPSKKKDVQKSIRLILTSIKSFCENIKQVSADNI